MAETRIVLENCEVIDPGDINAHLVRDGFKALEKARQDKVIGHPLDAAVTVKAPPKLYDLLHEFGSELREIFIVSQVVLERDGDSSALTVEVGRAAGAKCQRCWVYDTSVGADKEQPEVCQRCLQTIDEGS